MNRGQKHSEEHGHEQNRDLEEMIASAPHESRPPQSLACRQDCPQAHWFKAGKTLVCICLEGHFFTWPKLALSDCTGRMRARDLNEMEIGEYLDEVIDKVPVAARPDQTVVCRRNCPMAVWSREDEKLRCYCKAYGARTWPAVVIDDCIYWRAVQNG